MIRKIKNLVWAFLNKLGIGGAVQLYLQSGIKDDGWFNSFHTKHSVDKSNKPIPWNTYSYLKFIEPRLKKDFDLFEFGSGNSTRWYAERVGTIKAVENDSRWAELVSKNVPGNVKVVYKDLKYGGDYANEVFSEDKKYHIIIVDGRDRVNCAKNSAKQLTTDGVIVLDNSERIEYKEVFDFLLQNGFKKIDFWGLSPIIADNNCTTVFYREQNCLHI